VGRNQVVLTGSLIERKELRYTPAGIPALDVRIGHASEQAEAGRSRHVSLEIEAVALGPLAEQLSRAAGDRSYRFRGFLAPRSLKSRQLVLHLNEFDLSED
jgi:primosomal replication protein N